MKLNGNEYTVESATGGGFYAYVVSNTLCSAYGESPEEAYENLEQVVDDWFGEMYLIDDFA
jgi:predicted RNase H-like HicB family nuclease